MHTLQLHYRQYLVGLLFADLPSLSLFIFILVVISCVRDHMYAMVGIFTITVVNMS